jgi:hypothetical protein
MPQFLLAGLDGSFARAAMVIGLILLVIHLLLLAGVLYGHWALWKRKRRFHVIYLLPFTWYFLGGIGYVISMDWYPEFARAEWWPLGHHPEEESAYLALLYASLVLPAHGTLITRLMRRPNEPAVTLLALWAFAWVAVFPPAGLVCGRAALRRIRREPQRYGGKVLAWFALILNALLSFWLVVALGAWLYDTWQ